MSPLSPHFPPISTLLPYLHTSPLSPHFSPISTLLPYLHTSPLSPHFSPISTLPPYLHTSPLSPLPSHSSPPRSFYLDYLESELHYQYRLNILMNSDLSLEDVLFCTAALHSFSEVTPPPPLVRHSSTNRTLPFVTPPPFSNTYPTHLVKTTTPSK